MGGGLSPHLYCLPILKRETHRLALTTGGYVWLTKVIRWDRFCTTYSSKKKKVHVAVLVHSFNPTQYLDVISLVGYYLRRASENLSLKASL